MAKNHQKLQKMWFLRFGEPQYFFSAHLPLLVCWDHPKLPSYAISAKTNDSNSRKWPKTLKNRKKMRFLRFAEPQHFFFENRASSLFSTYLRATSCQKSKRSYGGKYENFCHGQTGQTEGILKDQTVGPKKTSIMWIKRSTTFRLCPLPPRIFIS